MTFEDAGPRKVRKICRRYSIPYRNSRQKDRDRGFGRAPELQLKLRNSDIPHQDAYCGLRKAAGSEAVGESEPPTTCKFMGATDGVDRQDWTSHFLGGMRTSMLAATLSILSPSPPRPSPALSYLLQSPLLTAESVCKVPRSKFSPYHVEDYDEHGV